MPETPEEGTKRIRGEGKDRFAPGGLLKPLALFPCEYCQPDPATGKVPVVAVGSNCAKCRRFPSWPYREAQTAEWEKAEAARKAAGRR